MGAPFMYANRLTPRKAVEQAKRGLIVRLAWLIVAAIIVVNSSSVSPTGLPLKKIAEFALPGRPTRLDYQSLDAHRHLLFIAHLGDSVVIVFNTKTSRVVTTIPGIAAVHGVLAVPSRNTVYASATGTDELVAIDEQSFKIKWRAPAGIYPDGIAFDPLTQRLFVSDEHGNTEAVIDATRGIRIATIALGGEVGNTQYDPRSRHIFANVQSRTELVEIDPRSAVVIRRMHLDGCEGNHGLLIDAVNVRAFVGCEDSSTFLWIDLPTMRTRQAWPTGNGPDVLALDAKAGIVYVGSESGVVSIFRNGKTVTKMAEGLLAPEAHTVSVDPQSRLSYWPLEDVVGRPVLRIMELQR